MDAFPFNNFLERFIFKFIHLKSPGPYQPTVGVVAHFAFFNQQPIDSEPDEVRTIFDYTLSAATNMNELIIASMFGIFGVLTLLQSTKPLTLEWTFLTLVYYVLAGLGIILYGRSHIYSLMAYTCMHGVENQNVSVKPLLREEIFRAVYEETSKWTPVGRFMLKHFEIYETLLRAWKFWVPSSVLGAVIIWVFVALI